MREKGQNEAAKTLETPVFSRGIEILTEKFEFSAQPQVVMVLVYYIFASRATTF